MASSGFLHAFYSLHPSRVTAHPAFSIAPFLALTFVVGPLFLAPRERAAVCVASWSTGAQKLSIIAGARALFTYHIEAYLPLSLLCIASPTSGPAPLEVTIEARLSGGMPPDQFIYVFNAASPDGGLHTTSTRVSTVYTQPGLYEALVTAFDSKGQRFRAECGDSNGVITVSP